MLAYRIHEQKSRAQSALEYNALAQRWLRFAAEDLQALIQTEIERLKASGQRQRL